MAKKVDFKRPEYTNELPKWETVDDCDKGQQAITQGGETYLPKPNATDTSPENQARYEAYLTRAMFANYTQKTISGLVGEVYSKDPEVELPSTLEVLKEDVDDTGVTLNQQSKKTVRNVLKFGRGALFVDYPQVEGQVSRADQESGKVRPSIVCYDPRCIINWRVAKVGFANKLTLVVIEEEIQVVDPEDEFTTKPQKQWRVLKMEEGIYKREIWVKSDDKTVSTEDFVIVPGSEVYPVKGNGQFWEEIPFIFPGSQNNDPDVDMSPTYDLAVINIGHYRNSADNEESSFLVGQPTLAIAGLTQGWVDKNFKNGVQFGSRAAVLLPEGGSANLVQADPNTIPFAGMEHKEKQMVAIGARIVQDSSVAKTATQAGGERASETSVLSNVSRNVSQAYKQCLLWSWMYSDSNAVEDSEEIKYELNTDYEISRLDPQLLLALVSTWQSGLIDDEEARSKITKMNLGITDLEDWKENLEQNPPGMPEPETFNAGGDE